MTPRTKALDVIVYGFGVTVLVFAVSVVIGWTIVRSWFGVEYTMFLIGWLMLGYSVLRMQRLSSSNRESELKASSDSPPAFQRSLQQLSPLKTRALTPEETLAPEKKLFVGSIFVLVASIVLEVVLGVSPG